MPTIQILLLNTYAKERKAKKVCHQTKLIVIQVERKNIWERDVQFKPHYNFDICVRGRVMICYMKGIWNLEGASVYFEEIKQHALALKANTWVRIAEISEFEGGPLELMEQLIKIQQWSLKHNCVHLFLVNPKSLNAAVIDKNKERYHKTTYCESIEQALALASTYLKE